MSASAPRSQMFRVEDVLDNCVPEEQRADLMRVMYGCDLELDGRLELSPETCQKALELKVDLRAYRLYGSAEEVRAPRLVRVGAVQHQMPLKSTEPVAAQLAAVHSRMEKLVAIAAAADVHILCLQETWSMPFFICTREKKPWCEFAEAVPGGASTQLLQRLAAQHRMVIISPMLERDEVHGDTIWNCAAVIGPDGKFLGKTRKNHIPRVGDFNESTYYMESELGHPVFDTPYGKVAVNICYGRHHPQNWMAFGINGAEIVFNPSATVDGLSETFWPVEARNAAIANSYFTVAINRVGTERFPNAFTSGNGAAAHHEFGHFYGSSYIAAPDGRRTPGLSRDKDGILVTELDLNLCRQIKDDWGFRMTQRLPLYAELLNRACRPDFKPQVESSRTN